MSSLVQWHYLNNQPVQAGTIKSQLTDFCVSENLGYCADGEGEHLFLLIEKRGLNTAFVAKQIAIWANVPQRDVSYAGLKDKYGVTKQTFSVQLPGRDAPALSLLDSPQLSVISSKRNSKKLRRGALKGNHFDLLIRGLTEDVALNSRLKNIAKKGVPNYFGLQRFGHDGQNIDAAHQLFNGKKVKNRDKRSMYLSAARSLIFNDVVSARIEQGLHLSPMLGDAFVLNGSKASFTPEAIDQEILARFEIQDIVLSAPMVGKGNKVHSDALNFESQVIASHQELANGLNKHGLSHERRALLVLPTDMQWNFEPQGLRLSFGLPAGSYATSVMREIALITDASSSVSVRE